MFIRPSAEGGGVGEGGKVRLSQESSCANHPLQKHGGIKQQSIVTECQELGVAEVQGREVGNVERTQAGTVTRAGFQRVSYNEFRRQWEAPQAFPPPPCFDIPYQAQI